MSARLRTIDMYVMYWGKVSRQNVMETNEVGTATASKALSDYMDRAPGNIKYNHRSKTYDATKTFKSIYDTPAENVLELFAYGRLITHFPTDRQSFTPGNLAPALNTDIVATITRAIVSKSVLDIRYTSASSNKLDRVVFPTTVFSRGGVWYLRAFDLTKREYRTYRMPRIASVCNQGLLKETLPVDEDWESSVIITLAPHTRHSHKEAIKFDLGLTDQFVKNIESNRVLAPFDLVDWRVDCSANGDLDPRQFPLQLMNRGELLRVTSLNIAPGINW